jgi:hypothetical protein
MHVSIRRRASVDLERPVVVKIASPTIPLINLPGGV